MCVWGEVCRCVHIYKELYFKKLAYVIVGADKSELGVGAGQWGGSSWAGTDAAVFRQKTILQSFCS